LDNRAIGYIDSGVGGLTVVKQAFLQIPNEQVYYIGDTKRMPYGPRPQAEVLGFTWQMVNYLLKKDIKMLVVACNTATAAALPELQNKLEIPVIGVIQPGVNTALATTKQDEIGVIATAGTVKSLAYYNALLSGHRSANITQLAAPEFVDVVENKDYTSPEAAKIVADKLAYFKNHQVDTLILGCTHFPLLEPFIQAAMGPEVTLVNSGAETINAVVQTLEQHGLRHDPLQHVERSADEYFTTGHVARFAELGEKWLEIKQMSVKHLDIVENALYLHQNTEKD
jgi:glutamate racemase